MDRNEFLLFILIFSLSAFLEIYLATEAQSPKMILKQFIGKQFAGIWPTAYLIACLSLQVQ